MGAASEPESECLKDLWSSELHHHCMAMTELEALQLWYPQSRMVRFWRAFSMEKEREKEGLDIPLILSKGMK